MQAVSNIESQPLVSARSATQLITSKNRIMFRSLILVAVASILFQSEAFKQSSFNRHVSLRKTALADFSILHDTGMLTSSIDAIHHVVGEVAKTDFHSFQSSLNIADGDVPAAAASIYSKVDKTGFIGTCADYIERAIDLSHELFLKLGIKNSYGFSIILFTFLSKFSMQMVYSNTRRLTCLPPQYFFAHSFREIR